MTFVSNTLPKYLEVPKIAVAQPWPQADKQGPWMDQEEGQAAQGWTMARTKMSQDAGMNTALGALYVP